MFYYIKTLIKNIISNYPNLYYFLIRFKYSKKKFFNLTPNEKTELVIEGYPRSGNTFFVTALKYTQKRKLNLAHHLHNIAQIKHGLENKIPVVILLREPKEAVKSLILRENYQNQTLLLKNYFFFYKFVKKNKKQILIFKFETIIKNFDKCIKKINKTFNMNYAIKKLNNNDIKKIFIEIDKISKNQKENSTLQSGRPNIYRKKIKLKLKDSIWITKTTQIYKLLKKSAI